MIRFNLVRDNPVGDLAGNLKKITDYLLTFVGDISLQSKDQGSVVINYIGTPVTAILKTDSDLTKRETTESGQMTLSCDKNDQLSVHLIKNITSRIGYRIFNTQTHSYLVNDPNILDLTTAPIDKRIIKIFKKYHLTPLFQFRDSLVFFAKDKSDNIHLINRHLLEHLKNNSKAKSPHKEFSVKVADNIGHFVALFDRGLVPLSYYKCLDNDTKVINLSGFNIDKIARDIYIEPIYFDLDSSRQIFVQGNAPPGILVKKGLSLLKTLKLKKYLAIKIGKDVNFVQKGKSLIPKLSVSIYLD